MTLISEIASSFSLVSYFSLISIWTVEIELSPDNLKPSEPNSEVLLEISP
jgi:hypothetical protein